MNKLELKEPSQKLLVIKPSSLGDVIHSLPFLNSIRRCFPQAEVHWVIARGLYELLKGHPMVNKLWIINKDDWKKPSRLRHTIIEMKTLFRELRKERFDIAIDLQGLLRSGLIAMITGAKLRIGLEGFKESREGSRLFYTHRVFVGARYVHAVDRYMKVADFLGCDTSEIMFPLPEFETSVSHLLTEVRDSYAVIVPGARWQTKRWRPEMFGELARLLKIKCLIVGTDADKEIAEGIVNSSDGYAISLTGKTNLRELTTIIKAARFLIGTDSGPMHIAVALGVPVFALFGTTSPLRTGPYKGNHTIISSNLPCSPCFKKRCDDLKCMDEITVQMVYSAINEKLNLL